MTALLIVIALLAYTGGILAFGRAPQYINSNILGTIINLIATLVPAGLFLLVSSQRYVPAASSIKGYVWAVVGGICIGVFTLAMTKLFSDGNNVGFVTPLVYGGAVLLASLAGIVFFSEKTDVFRLAGLFMIVGGIALISYATWRSPING